MKHIVTQDSDILSLLSLFYPDCSKSTLRSWLKLGRISVNNRLIKEAKTLVSQGQIIEVHKIQKKAHGGIPIVYEDSDIVVVDKPSGLLSVSAAYDSQSTVHAFLKAQYYPRKIYVVHRLDQDTSGLILFALSEKAYIVLKEMFEKHEIERTYLGIVEGHLKEETGSWKSYLYEDKNYKVHSTSDPQKGKLSITHFAVQSQSRMFSWVQFTLETGKKNQIRAHCQEAGHPIVGDKKYGSNLNPFKRVCLHAQRLQFKHPITLKPMLFESPIPMSMKQKKEN